MSNLRTGTQPAPAAETERLAAIALFVLIAIGANERVIFFLDEIVGLVINSAILVVLLLYTSATWNRPRYKWLLSLALVPLLRLLSLTLPLRHIDPIYWYAIISAPLFIAIALMRDRLGLSWRQVGINWQGTLLQPGVALTGFGVGYAHYQILQPEPLIDHLTPVRAVISGIILMICAGFVDELMFRGIIQQAANRMLGEGLGIVYVASLYAVLTQAERSPATMIFWFAAGLAAGWVATKSQNIIGIMLAHGIANVVALVIL